MCGWFFTMRHNGFVYEKCVFVSADFRNENRKKANMHFSLVGTKISIFYTHCACCTTTSSNIAKGLHKIEKFINFMPMQGKKNYQEKLFTSFKLSDRV